MGGARGCLSVDVRMQTIRCVRCGAEEKGRKGGREAELLEDGEGRRMMTVTMTMTMTTSWTGLGPSVRSSSSCPCHAVVVLTLVTQTGGPERRGTSSGLRTTLSSASDATTIFCIVHGSHQSCMAMPACLDSSVGNSFQRRRCPFTHPPAQAGPMPPPDCTHSILTRPSPTEMH